MYASTSDTPPTAAKRAPFLLGGRKPLHPLVGASGPNATAPAGSTSSPGLKKFSVGAGFGIVPRSPIEINKVEHAVEYYEVFYTKSSKKKHKNWENGSVVRKGNGAELRGEDGAMITKTILKSSFTASFTEGQTLFIGSFECEVVKMVTEDEYITKGADFACNRDSPAASITPSFKLPLPVRAGFKKVGVSAPSTVPMRQALAPVTPTARFCNDPKRIGAHCLNPNATESEALIVVDPVVGAHLKPHQVKGVQFLFDRTMPEGVRPSDSQIQGCILADEMGLGKTVQTIALIWTLLKQSRFSAFQPSVKKAIVVVPSSLVSNWAAEFQKWLGVQRINIQVVSTGKSASGDVRDFCLGSVKDVLIVSYDLLRRHIDVSIPFPSTHPISAFGLDIINCALSSERGRGRDRESEGES
jgi:DNA repair and recombination protein RAD54B